MPDQFVLGVDLDGVVADHTRRFREIVAELRGVDPESLPMDRSWDFQRVGVRARTSTTGCTSSPSPSTT